MTRTEEIIWEDVDIHIEDVGRVESFIKALRTHWNKGLIFGFRTKRLVRQEGQYFVSIVVAARSSGSGYVIALNDAAVERLPLGGLYLHHPGVGPLTYVSKNEREPFADLDEALSTLRKIMQSAVEESKGS